MRYVRLIAISIAIMSLLFTAAVISGLRYNLTESVPVGFYWLNAVEPKTGDIVSVCPAKSEAMDLAIVRGYVARGSCAAGYPELMKIVVAKAGDTVSVSASGVIINDIPLKGSLPQSQDPAGQPLPFIRFTSYVLGSDEYFLVNTEHPFSYDSRYIGIVKKNEIQGVAYPIFNKR